MLESRNDIKTRKINGALGGQNLSHASVPVPHNESAQNSHAHSYALHTNMPQRKIQTEK